MHLECPEIVGKARRTRSACWRHSFLKTPPLARIHALDENSVTWFNRRWKIAYPRSVRRLSFFIQGPGEGAWKPRRPIAGISLKKSSWESGVNYLQNKFESCEDPRMNPVFPYSCSIPAPSFSAPCLAEVLGVRVSCPLKHDLADTDCPKMSVESTEAELSKAKCALVKIN
jgi:hypothetical protein